MIKVVLFDFDGVLTEDAYGSLSLINYITEVTGVDYDTFDRAYRRHNGALLRGLMKHEDIWETVCNEVGSHINFSVLNDAFKNTVLDHNMIEVAIRLKEQGYRLGIITDNKTDRIAAIVEHNGLNDIFEHIIVSGDVGSRKDEAKIFDVALERFAVGADDCVFIDNSKNNLLVPSSKGFETIYYDDKDRNIEKLLNELGVMGIRLP